MKVRVTFEAELILPDDWELTEAPEDEGPALKHGSAYFQPMVDWLERKFDLTDISPDEREGAPRPSWVSIEEGAYETLLPDSMSWQIERIPS